MKKLALLFCTATALAALASPASATVLDFDDIGADGAVPLNYGGLDWSAGAWSVFGGDQAPYTAHSGSYRATTGFDATDAQTRIGFAAPATFQGAWFAGLDGATVSFELYLGGKLVATSATLDPGITPSFLSSGYAGLIDAVEISSPYQASYVMDDFSFTQAVPEPGSCALMLGGLGVVGFVLRRRRA
jgi:opacity protein-like surface antigen